MIELPVKASYAPNVYVSVLAVRGRIAGPQPTALIDLGKPAFKLGVAEIKVGWQPHELKVQVAMPQDAYRVRETVRAKVSVTRADGGRLPEGTEIAFAAVDEALLELKPNESWKLLEAMMQPRGLAVVTATAQMQVVGRRHFGRKALPPGGGGGRASARELFDTLLLWKGSVVLDANGEATLEVPLNDSLSSFRLVAIATSGESLFGTGSVSVRTTQDLMLFAGLPPLVREGDRFRALFTLRNTTPRPMAVALSGTLAPQDDSGTPAGKPGKLPVLEANLAPDESRELAWDVAAPFDAARMAWDVSVVGAGGATDRVKLAQKVIPAYPVSVYQATLLQLGQPLNVKVQIPAGAVPNRGGVSLALRAKLADDLAGVREFMSRYPYICLEQKASVAVALRDPRYWEQVMRGLPDYLDRDGLARYFASDWLQGSDTLTTYLLAIAHEAGWEIPEGPRERMLQALDGFVAGRITRLGSLPTADLTIRKLAAIEALSRYDRATPQMLTSLTIAPNLWPTSAVIDWIGVLKHVDNIPERDSRLREAQQIIRSRLNFQGTTMGFSTERSDALWWLMISSDVNANRGVLALLDQPAWRNDLPRMASGALQRRLRGHWNTTVANAWGVLAMEEFAAAFEAEPVAGTTTASLAARRQSVDWSVTAEGGTLDFAWPRGAEPLAVEHAGSGKPWVTLISRAALPLTAPLFTGYRVTRTVTPIEQKKSGQWSRGDVARVSLTVDAQSDMTWVVVSDPIPAGATILGSGLGRDSTLLTRGERQRGFAWPAFEERRFDGFRAYYEFVGKGEFKLEYTLRLNNPGSFVLPTTRVEAMYAPEMFGELPNAMVVVKP